MALGARKLAGRLSHACRANIARRENAILQQEIRTMSAYCFEIGGEILQSSDLAHRGQSFVIVTACQMRGSSVSAAFPRCAYRPQGDATHTDPQFLHSAVAP
jgi:hypothetical protein